MAFVDWNAAGCVVSGSTSKNPVPVGHTPVTADVPNLACIIPVIASVVQIAFYFLGSVAILFLIWGVIRFALSQGDPKAVQGAKNTITYAIIGVIIVFLSFLILGSINNFLGLPTNLLFNFGFNQGP